MLKKHRNYMSKTLSILVCVGVITSNISSFAIADIKSENKNVEIEMINEDNFNGGYEVTEIASAAFADFWTNKTKPKFWDLRVYKEFTKPVGTVVIDDVFEGTNAVKIDLNKSVGFFQTGNNVPISGGRDYEISTSIKTEKLEVDSTNSAHKPVALRVEQFGADGKLVSGGRSDLVKLEGTNDWKEYKYSIKTQENAVSMKIVFVFDTGLSTGATGSIFIDNTSITANEVKPESIEILSEDLTVGVSASSKLDVKIMPEDSDAKEIIWSSSDESVVSVENGVFKANKIGDATVTATLKGYENLTSSINIKVSDKILIENVEFEDFNLENGRKVLSDGNISPRYANEKYTLKSNNPLIADVVDGVLHTKGIGSTEVLAISDSGKTVGSFVVNVEENVIDKYDILANKLYDSLIPNKMMVASDVDTINYLESVSENGQIAWDAMNKNEDRESLWSEFDSSTSSSSYVTKSFEKILMMAKAYETKGTTLYQNAGLLKDIVSALDFMNEKVYREGIYFANWWDWQIGAPQKLNDILIIMRNNLTDEQIKKQTDASSWYVENARDQWRGNTTVPEVIRETIGANRTDMVKVVAVRSMITKEGDKLLEASKDILQELEYVTKSDGFYTDGSIVQHESIAYTGTYGAILLSGIGETVYMLDDSEWAIDMTKLDNMYNVVTDSFEPLMYNGLMMDMVSGRSISRFRSSDAGHGTGVIKSMVKYYSRFAPEPYKSDFLSMIKGWLVNNDEYDFIANTADYEFKMLAKSIVNDKSIKVKEELEGIFNFANMDRVVYRDDDFGFGLSMYSDRISNYESINGEHLKGFHTADGMTYLYNGDLGQYSGNYWATVDPYRLSGTTVDSMKLKDSAAHKKKSPASFVGGSSIDNEYGAFAMQLDKSNDAIGQDLKAKKSYFMIDEQIVCLGTDISSTTGTNIETIVENRKISESGREKITVDNKNSVKKIGDSLNEEVSWVHFDGEGEDNNIGYYFPNKATINLKRENREGTWKSVNNGGTTDIVDNNFMTMWFDHGVAPKNASYEYIIVPNADKKDMKHFAKESEIEILANNSKVQAVKDSDEDVLAMNIWEDGEHKIDFVTAYNKSSITIAEDDGELIIGVSDPTMKNTGKIKVVLDKKLKKVISNNERVSVTKDGDKTILEIDVNGANGQTIETRLKVK